MQCIFQIIIFCVLAHFVKRNSIFRPAGYNPQATIGSESFCFFLPMDNAFFNPWFFAYPASIPEHRNIRNCRVVPSLTRVNPRDAHLEIIR